MPGIIGHKRSLDVQIIHPDDSDRSKCYIGFLFTRFETPIEFTIWMDERMQLNLSRRVFDNEKSDTLASELHKSISEAWAEHEIDKAKSGHEETQEEFGKKVIEILRKDNYLNEDEKQAGLKFVEENASKLKLQSKL